MSEFYHGTALPHLESRRSCRNIACYRPHTHDRFSVGLVDSGTTVFSGAAGEPVLLEAGDVIVIPAGHVHSCNPEDGPWRYQMMQADQDWIAALLPAHSPDLLSGINVFRQPEGYRCFGAVNDLLFSNADAIHIEAAFREAFKQCTLHEIEHRLTADTDAELVARLAPALTRLRDDESNPLLDELAAIAGMGKYQFIRAMKRMTGFAPLAWRQNQRVITARQMLRDGRSLADTAHALGFVDQSHFHRVFRSHVAASPGTYRG